MSEVLSLSKQCLLTLVGHAPSLSPDYLALLPPRLRTVLAFNLSVSDLHRVQQCRDFTQGLKAVDMDVLWKHRYETTLLKFSNIASLELDVEIHHPGQSVINLTWKDRYLLSCFMNIPRIYQSRELLPSIGVSLFGIADIQFADGQVFKEVVNINKYGLLCCQGSTSKTQSRLSSNFVSQYHLPLLDKAPFNKPVGNEWPTLDRIDLFSRMLPSWTPPYFPLQYDEILNSVPSLDGVKGVIVYSGWYQTRPNAEIDQDDTSVIVVSKSLKESLQAYSTSLDSAFLFAPAMLKIKRSKASALSVTATTLANIAISSLSTLKHLSIAMHDADTSCLDALPVPSLLPSLYHCLCTLHLKVLRPTFTEPCTLLGSTLSSLFTECNNFKDLILQGLALPEGGFISFMLSFFNNPPRNDEVHQSVTLRNVKILSSDDDDLISIDKQVMPQECWYTKSLFIHRLLNWQALRHLLAAYDELLMDRLSISLPYDFEEDPLVPSHLIVHAKSVHVERIRLNEDRLQLLHPVLFSNVDAIELSLGPAQPTDALAIYVNCIGICSKALTYLDFKHITPGSISQLDALFTVIFTLPESILSNLVLDPCHLIEGYASSQTQETQLGRGASVQWPAFSLLRDSEYRRLFDDIMKAHKRSSWELLYSIWKSKAKGVKLKLLYVSMLALEEFSDELELVSKEVKKQ